MTENTPTIADLENCQGRQETAEIPNHWKQHPHDPNRFVRKDGLIALQSQGCAARRLLDWADTILAYKDRDTTEKFEQFDGDLSHWGKLMGSDGIIRYQRTDGSYIIEPNDDVWELWELRRGEETQLGTLEGGQTRSSLLNWADEVICDFENGLGQDHQETVNHWKQHPHEKGHWVREDGTAALQKSPTEQFWKLTNPQNDQLIRMIDKDLLKTTAFEWADDLLASQKPVVQKPVVQKPVVQNAPRSLEALMKMAPDPALQSSYGAFMLTIRHLADLGLVK